MVKNAKSLTSVDRDADKLELSDSASRNINGAGTVESSVAVFLKLNAICFPKSFSNSCKK